MRATRLLLFRLGLQDGAAFGHLPCELVVRPCPICKFPLIQMQDPLHGAVQKAPVMADDEDGMGVFLKVSLKPERAFEIEVVGRFVQKQQIGLRKQHARQRDAHPPTARKGGARHQLLFGIEA